MVTPFRRKNLLLKDASFESVHDIYLCICNNVHSDHLKCENKEETIEVAWRYKHAK